MRRKSVEELINQQAAHLEQAIVGRAVGNVEMYVPQSIGDLEWQFIDRDGQTVDPDKVTTWLQVVPMSGKAQQK